MTSQGSLFDRQKPRGPPTPKYRAPLEKRPVKLPWGFPDKRGNLFWEKLHKELEKLPVEHREFFNHITIVSLPAHLDILEKCLRMFNRATDYDRIDFDVSRGMLGE